MCCPGFAKPLQAHFKIEVLNSVHFASLVEFGCQGNMMPNAQRTQLPAVRWILRPPATQELSRYLGA